MMTPRQRSVARQMLEEVYAREVEVARLRHEAALLRTGLHPGIPVAKAMVAWGEAVATLHKGDGK